MSTYDLSARTLPLVDTFDVIVVGGGPAGCTAAIAAAREGAKTLLVEATGSLGGMGTAGLVPAWCPFSDQEQIIYRGLAQKILFASNRGMKHVDDKAHHWVPISPEHLKSVYDRMVSESGAVTLFNTQLCGVDTGVNSDVSAVILSNKSGLTAYQAHVYIDCSGDADLAVWAGSDFQKGDDSGSLQPATHCFALGNVNEEAYLSGPRLNASHPESPIYKILKDKRYSDIPDTHLCNNLIGPGTVGFNAGHLYNIDNTKPETVSVALMRGRHIAAAYRDALAEYFPEAFANAFVVATGSLMGIRETRRIVGDYVLTVDDYLARKSFDDEICRNSYFIDIHFPEETVKEIAEGGHEALMQKIEERCHHYDAGESHGVPYRCLTPRALKNVLVAGRSISTDRTVQGSTRVMPVCLAMGEAAGMAAAHAMQNHQNDVHAVNTDTLRERLRAEGGYLP